MKPVQWILLLVALFVLNFALTFHNVWPTPWITTRHELSVEIAVVVALMAAWRGLVGPLPPRVITAAAVVLLVMCLGRYSEVTAPALYGRRINIYWDARHVPRVAAMIAQAAPAWLLAVGGAGVLALLAGSFVALRWSLRRVQDALAQRSARRVLGGLSAALVVFYMLGYAPVSLPSWQWFSIPVSTTYWRQAAFVREAMDETRTASRLPPERSFAGYDLEHAAGADVLLMFVESYGAVAFDAPELAQRLAPGRAALAEAASATDRRVVSAFAESPTIGGASWLAHSSFVTGSPIEDQGVYELLLTQRRESLTTLFADAGFRVVAALPGLRSAWPEGAFYEFDTIYDAQALDYAGPEFGWWRIPDQYTLAKVDALELGPDLAERAPVFVFFATISTHMPFAPTPPYEPDWRQLVSAQPYAHTAARDERNERDNERADEADDDRTDDRERTDEPTDERTGEPDWTNLRPVYADSLAYTYEYLAGYLERRRERDLVLIVLGDHQPPASVSGEGARWDVPVHVITSRGEILDELIDAGFADGIEPDAGSLGELHELTDVLLGAMSSGAR